MAENPDPKVIDKRTAERYLRMGVLDEKEYQRYLEQLPDAADKAVSVRTVMLDDASAAAAGEAADDGDADDEDDDEVPDLSEDEALLAAGLGDEEPPGGSGGRSEA